ncbi:MAG: class I SAM-dependent methyltransferase [Dorea sp.]|nr:class I SAM-dependent methyltransferase [Dorea sp.]
MRKIVIYGIGKIGRSYIERCVGMGVKGLELVDGDNSLWGTEVYGMKIQNPDKILWEKYSLVVVAAGNQHSSEILDRLMNVYKVSEEKIISCSDAVILQKGEIYNWGNMEFGEGLETDTITSAKEIGGRIKKESLNNLGKYFFYKKHRIINKWMHYFEAYERFFMKYKNKDLSILEIGVFKGGSLQMWKNYFEGPCNKVMVYGIDINPECKKLEEDNIKIFIGSQEDRDFLHKVKEEIGKVDILIDDGGHTMNQQIVSFEELFDLVDDNGIYLCEDLHTSYMERYGGQYKGDTFIEYSKNLIDYLHAQYSETSELQRNKYSDSIKYITYCDSMIFIEKKKKTTRSIEMKM